MDEDAIAGRGESDVAYETNMEEVVVLRRDEDLASS